jgi:hypothetical protein
MIRILLLLLLFSTELFAQSTLITPGTNGNIQLPNLTNAQIQAINNPQNGSIVFDKTFQVLRFFDGTSWVCVGCNPNSIQNIKYVKVKSFTLSSSGTNFTSTNIRDFKASDNAVGDVIDATTTPSSANGFLINKDEIIVLDSNIPSQILNQSLGDIAQLLNRVNWTFSYKYQQNVDVSVNSDHTNLVYLVREAGDFERREGVILGTKVYKFTNKLITEKYGNTVTLIDNLINSNSNLNLISLFGISEPSNYHVFSTSQFFPINSSGIMTFPASNNKPQNAYGLIYLLPKSMNLPSYRFRVFTHKLPDATTKALYFNQDGSIKNRTTYITNYFKNVVNNNIPKILHLSDGTTQGGRIKGIDDYDRIPPPTVGTEDL